MDIEKKHIPGWGLDALDCLLLLGFRIVKEMPKTGSLLGGPDYRLCGAKVDGSQKEAVVHCLEEVDEAKEYYIKRLIQEGKRLP
ncbi:MAG: hypothetical protein CMB80_01755 [Flammeovirgaceae bacterium]|nr:hypothetical protein [Flammeovirgaceae bacterium]|tara:strand:+ start:177 stop:428 length:252 start_codon:yes stop_codon:yes gene_type:complete